MGMDVYGLNPNNPNDAIKPEQMDWSKKPTDKESEDYFKKLDNFQEEVVGHYFRNNVWYWRPLWDFVCHHCNHILTPKNIKNGHSNSGEKICKTKAIRIGKKMLSLIKSGDVAHLEKEHILNMEQARLHNNLINEQLKVIENECKAKHGKHLVPASYPEPYRTEWDEIYHQKDWNSDYPFTEENVKYFAEFCLNSGGFEIC